MKQFIYKSLILGSVLTAASCSNSEYEFDKLFPTLSKEIQEIYNTTKEGNSQRWLMIDIKNSDCVYDDVLKLIKIRRESK